MAGFKFRFKTVLAVREAARDQRRAQLAEAYAADRKLKERRAELQHELDHHRNALRQGISPGQVDVDRLLTGNRYELVLRAEMAVVLQHEQTLAGEIERRRQLVIAADREVRVMEKLRERQREEFQKEVALRDMKQMDEIAARVTRGIDDSTGAMW